MRIIGIFFIIHRHIPIDLSKLSERNNRPFHWVGFEITKQFDKSGLDELI